MGTVQWIGLILNPIFAQIQVEEKQKAEEMAGEVTTPLQRANRAPSTGPRTQGVAPQDVHIYAPSLPRKGLENFHLL
jgi:hypothetical protein